VDVILTTLESCTIVLTALHSANVTLDPNGLEFGKLLLMLRSLPKLLDGIVIETVATMVVSHFIYSLYNYMYEN